MYRVCRYSIARSLSRKRMTGTLERQRDVWSVSQVAKTLAFHVSSTGPNPVPTPTSDSLGQLTLFKKWLTLLHLSARATHSTETTNARLLSKVKNPWLCISIVLLVEQQYDNALVWWLMCRDFTWFGSESSKVLVYLEDWWTSGHTRLWPERKTVSTSILCQNNL